MVVVVVVAVVAVAVAVAVTVVVVAVVVVEEVIAECLDSYTFFSITNLIIIMPSMTIIVVLIMNIFMSGRRFHIGPNSQKLTCGSRVSEGLGVPGDSTRQRLFK